jgi:hypothetical protein
VPIGAVRGFRAKKPGDKVSTVGIAHCWGHLTD